MQSLSPGGLSSGGESVAHVPQWAVHIIESSQRLTVIGLGSNTAEIDGLKVRAHK